MITEPLFYVVGTDERAYLAHSKRFWIRPFTRGNPGGYTPKSIGLFKMAEAKRLVTRPPRAAWGKPAGPITALLAPRCACCGKDEFRTQLVDPAAGPWRCYKHRDRNPCAIEGCTRSTPAPENSELPDAEGRLRNDQWICGIHWKRYVPPRSARRRAYNAFFRRAKREGWHPQLNRKFWRFWNTLIIAARRRGAEGYVDEATIKRLFGWEE